VGLFSSTLKVEDSSHQLIYPGLIGLLSDLVHERVCVFVVLWAPGLGPAGSTVPTDGLVHGPW
jgi:hypothetical protein